jgi:hypothetical protein
MGLIPQQGRNGTCLHASTPPRGTCYTGKRYVWYAWFRYLGRVEYVATKWASIASKIMYMRGSVIKPLQVRQTTRAKIEHFSSLLAYYVRSSVEHQYMRGNSLYCTR